MAQDAILHECPICGKQISGNTELEDHVVETHPDYATPDMQDSYNARHEGAPRDQGEEAA